MSRNFKNDTWLVGKDKQIDKRLYHNRRQYNHKHRFQFFSAMCSFFQLFFIFSVFFLLLLSIEKPITAFWFNSFFSLLLTNLVTGALTKSQFPVFTIYAQKSCLGLRPCSRAWCIDRVQGYKLAGFTKRSAAATSRRDCLEMCLGENEFTCR